jgi:hypothetical protein
MAVLTSKPEQDKGCLPTLHLAALPWTHTHHCSTPRFLYTSVYNATGHSPRRHPPLPFYKSASNLSSIDFSFRSASSQRRSATSKSRQTRKQPTTFAMPFRNAKSKHNRTGLGFFPSVS